MKIPRALMIEIERLGRLIFQGEISYEEALDALEPFLHKEEYRLLTSEILRKFLRRQIKTWLTSQIATIAEDEESGQQPLWAADLPPYIEIAVATRKHQNAMTIKDWEAAVAQAQVKADNAAGYCERVVRAWERAVRELHGDQTCGEAVG